MKLRIPEYVENLVPYKSGNKLEGGITREQFKAMTNLASNENPFGVPEKAKEAMRKAIDESHIYPDPSGSELVSALSLHYKINKNRIITGSGSDSLIQMIFNAFCTKGEEILTADVTFIGTYVNANKLGRKLRLIKTKDYGFDLKSILENINDNTRIIYLANPNNPSGTMFSGDEFKSFMEKVPDDVLVILDEAYWLYASHHKDYPNGLDYEYDNLIVLRTFSKCYGLAGARIGFAFAHREVINILYRVKLPFEPNIIALHGAIAALDDSEYVKKTVETNKKCLALQESKFDDLGINYVKGFGNFTMILFDDETEAIKFTKYMLENNVVVRHLPMFGLPNAVRINTGTLEQTANALDLIENFK
jgi:histidinol-phosphate aminotransferase